MLCKKVFGIRAREGNRTAIKGSSKCGVKTENKSSENISFPGQEKTDLSLINDIVISSALTRLGFLLLERNMT